MKQTYVLDSEIYHNYFLIGFMDIATDKVWSLELVGQKAVLSKDDRLWLRKFMKRHTVGFNSKGFDLPIIYAAIEGRTVGELKKIANDIIVGGMKPWDVEREWGIEIPRDIDHIDLIEVAPGKASLKIYNGRLHGKRMQDLPIHHDAVLTASEIDEVYDYWKNDLQATKLLFVGLKKNIELRTTMSRMFNTDLRSKSDAQLAEAMIKMNIEKIKGERLPKPRFPSGQTFRYVAPPYIKFTNEHLGSILDDIQKWDFRVQATGKVSLPEFLSESNIKIGNSVYRMGIGGLHSSEERVSHKADGSSVFLTDHDVTSYYPNIIITLGLYPESLGKVFLRVYKGMLDARVTAKKNMKAVESKLKSDNTLSVEEIAEMEAAVAGYVITDKVNKTGLNGSFGKLGSVYSVLFSANLLITVTLTGQLALLMLINRLEDAGISVVSGNTDGIVVKCQSNQLDLKKRIIAKWESDTGFATEAADYSAIYAASVNNYFAVKTDGEVKRKGHYAPSGLIEGKNPTEDICAEAVAAFLSNGTPISKTIRECRDIRKFVTVRNVTGGAIYGVKEVEFERISEKTGKVLKPGTKFDDSEAVYLGKAVRFYRSTESIGALHYKDSLNKVPKSDGCKPLMELPDEFPSDVDFGSYIKAAREMLYDIGYYEEL